MFKASVNGRADFKGLCIDMRYQRTFQLIQFAASSVHPSYGQGGFKPYRPSF